MKLSIIVPIYNVAPYLRKCVDSLLVQDIKDYEIILVDDKDAFEGVRLLAKKEGLLVGISSGAALHAAIELAKREENKKKNIVVVFPDSGDRYLSTPLFEE